MKGRIFTKKIIIGLICGIILFMPTVALASDSIQAYLSPSRVLFHFSNAVKEIDVSGDHGVLYYKDRAYIPLRTFATTMGASVNYEVPSPATGNLNKIDIYCSSNQVENDQTQPAATFASGLVQVYLSPSQVFFHLDNTIKEIDVSGDSGILYYQDRIYVPLRTFATAMGATINYGAASPATGNLNRIDIYSSSQLDEKDLTIQDPEGYVSIGNLNIIKDKNGYSVLTSGTIQVNKELTGKAIDILVGPNRYKAWVYIQNEDIEQPKVGDIRPFQTNFIFDQEISPVAVDVHDILKPEIWEDISKLSGNPIAIMIGPLISSNEILMGKVVPVRVDVFNSSDNALTVDPFNVGVDIYKDNPQDQSSELVYSCKLPTISGTISRKSGFPITVFWNQRNLVGDYVLPGEYYVCLKDPVIYYSPVGSNDRITYNIVEHSGMRPRGYSFEIIDSAQDTR